MFNKNHKFFKFGFWALIIIVVTLINLFLNFEKSKNNSVNHIKNLDLKSIRLQTLMDSKIPLGKNFPNFSAYNIVSDKKEFKKFDELSLVLLLADYGCNRCQNRELKNCQKLFESNDELNVVCVMNTIDRYSALRLRKVTQVKFPMFVQDSSFFRNFSYSRNYPQLLLIHHNKINDTFLPIPEDDDFSEWFFEYVSVKIKDSLYFN